MARSIELIKQQIIDAKNEETGLSSLNSPSKAAIYNLWAFITAVAINVFEQVLDVFKLAIEKSIDTVAPGTPQWLNLRVFEFQSGDVAKLVNFVPSYEVIDISKRIITRASVKTNINQSVDVKVAKGEPPQALSGTEKSELISYLNILQFAGIQLNVISFASDKLFIEADIYYDGQYSAVIQANVIEAINTYLSQLPFDGVLKLLSLEDAIQGVAGVKDIVLKNVAARGDATAFIDKTFLVQDNKLLVKQWATIAGYIEGETTGGETFADKINFIIE